MSYVNNEEYYRKGTNILELREIPLKEEYCIEDFLFLVEDLKELNETLNGYITVYSTENLKNLLEGYLGFYDFNKTLRKAFFEIETFNTGLPSLIENLFHNTIQHLRINKGETIVYKVTNENNFSTYHNAIKSVTQFNSALAKIQEKTSEISLKKLFLNKMKPENSPGLYEVTLSYYESDRFGLTSWREYTEREVTKKFVKGEIGIFETYTLENDTFFISISTHYFDINDERSGIDKAFEGIHKNLYPDMWI